MRAAFATLGCKVNQAESAAMEGLLAGSGAEVVPFEEKADLYIINTCSVTAKSDYQSRQLVRKASRSGGQVIATGCYAELKQDELIKAAAGAALFISNQEKQHIVQFINHLPFNSTLSEPLSETSCSSPSRFFYSSSRSRAFLKVQDGCDSYCAYCIVPFARGRSRSLPINEALEAFNRLAEQGYQEVVFTGIHTGRYGRDFGTAYTLFNLVDKASQARPDIRIRLSSIEAEEFDPAFINMIQNRRLCPHLHIPLQSGSDEVLKLMNRKASVAYFKELVLAAAKQAPGIAIGTDVITGLPGESEKAFQMTYELLETLPISYFHVFPFSSRPGTLAEQMKNQVPVEVRKKRAALLRQLSQKKQLAYTVSFYGKLLDVITEDTCDSSYLRGLSHNYLKVLVRKNGAQSFRQRIQARFADTVRG
ncbi:MAG TPA: tRNA (N(6)-L-threonylcarbamoyladenosine(37)-C(2))-methylthiotransferase MtaB, partial [Thermodesulfovibrionia bacterium]|nr:tRNA (N(6)-L-threonylcarbamoyladenosine(37)-C(2))-methylthiotransferase MtaB [Thermodesulfovibrionia bacterium]